MGYKSVYVFYKAFDSSSIQA